MRICSVYQLMIVGFGTVSIGIVRIRTRRLRLGAIDTRNSSLASSRIAPRKQFLSTSIQKCDHPQNISDSDYKSQLKEDKKLMGWFDNLCEGSYIEMGALDGITYSNSYVFNKALEWKGVLIELLLPSYEKLKVNRHNEHAVINAGVCDSPKKLHYYEVADNPAVGGIYEFTAQSFREHWWSNISLDDPGLKEIECDTLDSLLLKNVPTQSYWDLFSLDVEGAELAVLQSINFDRVGFGIVFVEASGHNETKDLSVIKLMESKGYKYLEAYERSNWFMHQDFHHIYKELIH